MINHNVQRQIHEKDFYLKKYRRTNDDNMAVKISALPKSSKRELAQIQRRLEK